MAIGMWWYSVFHLYWLERIAIGQDKIKIKIKTRIRIRGGVGEIRNENWVAGDCFISLGNITYSK